MKKNIITTILIFSCISLFSQVLSGNITENFSASIGFDPAGYYTNYSYFGYDNMSYASGDYKIFPATGNAPTTIKKPVVIVEGFDPEQTFSAQGIYNVFSSAGNSLRNSGYDVFTLNFADTKDYLERNAMLVVELIKKINNSKVTNEEICIIGASMGGLITRYALTYMEANNIPHHTKLFVSYDAPQKGANMPFGIQYMMLDFHNSPYTVGATYTYWTYLANPAASQMLRYHVRSSDVPGLSVNYVKFMNKLKALNGCNGYPMNCKNVAVALGSLDGTGQVDMDGNPMIAGAGAFSYDVGSLQSGYVGTVPASPSVPSGYSALIESNGGYFVNTYRTLPSSIPIDIAPGGYTTIFGDVADGLENLGFNGLNTTTTRHCENACFIPTISSLDYNTGDFFHNIKNDINANIHLNYTPFDDIYTGNYSGYNDYHISSLDFSVASWISGQIINATSIKHCTVYDLNIASVTLSGLYDKKVAHDITTSNVTVNSGANVELAAANQISILPGTTLLPGSKFHAYIDPCTLGKSCGFSNTFKTENDEFSENQSYQGIGNTQYIKLADRKEDSQNQIFISVTPNPTSDRLQLKVMDELGNFIQGNLKISIYDAQGKTILTKTQYASEIIDVSRLESGVYMIQVQGDNTSQFEKFIKQ
jgi:hypothetical protein